MATENFSEQRMPEGSQNAAASADTSQSTPEQTMSESGETQAGLHQSGELQSGLHQSSELQSGELRTNEHDSLGPETSPPYSLSIQDGASAVVTDESSQAAKLPLMIGLGGSAGAIQALQDFFHTMPVDTGSVFVVVMHLSPDHESQLAPLLQRTTSMHVVQVRHTERVLPNCIYVIPPGKLLLSMDGHLRLEDIPAERGRRTAIDTFFRTLADTHGSQSVAIVLSGSGSDGALGIKRVKERGGLTIAQDPEQAEHRDMPCAAMDTSMVDWVLKVEDMHARIVKFKKHELEVMLPPEELAGERGRRQRDEDELESALREILTFLHNHTGRDFSCYKRATVLRRISRRMLVNGAHDLPTYLTFLRTHPGEAGALFQDLLISVTNFFRDSEAFDALAQTIPQCFSGKQQGDTVRVWIAACATGEEAYSIAMLCVEFAETLESPPGIQVFASDLDPDVIRTAREAIYPDAIVADISEERLKRFFVKEMRGYRVRRELREIVLFAVHDVLKDSPFSRLDLISARNLLIYLTRDAQRKVFDIFHYALNQNGILFLGSSEAVDDDSAQFGVCDKKHRIYRRLTTPRVGLPSQSGPSSFALAINTSHDLNASKRTLTASVATLGPSAMVMQQDRLGSWRDAHYLLVERFGPPSLIINSEFEIIYLSEHAGQYLQFPGGEASKGILHSVHPSLRLPLRAAIYQATEQNSEAKVIAAFAESTRSEDSILLRVVPAGTLAEGHFIVFFQSQVGDRADSVRATFADQQTTLTERLDNELEMLRSHLRDTVEQYEGSTEELKASNEELQAINEELRSATEELETSREELQSINEELTTVNQELKLKVEELGHSNSDLHNLMASTDIATLFLDRNISIMRYTPKAVLLFNLIPSDLGRPLSDLNPQLNYPELASDAAAVLNDLVPIEREVGKPDGRWFLARLLPYRTIEDRIAGVVLTFVEITERKRFEETIYEREERLRLAAEISGFGIWQYDIRQQTVLLDERVATMWSLAPGVCSRSSFLDNIHPQDRSFVDAAFYQALAPNGSSEFAVHFRIKQDSGPDRWIAVNGKANFEQLGSGRQANRLIGTALDISDIKAREHALQAADRNKNQFLATLAHELRNPLAPILNGVQALQMTELDSAIVRATLSTMERQVSQMVRLIDDLLDISRITQGKVRIQSNPCELNEILRMAAQTTERFFELAGVRFNLVLSPTPLPLEGDEARLSQVFCNLLSNACKYTDRGGEVFMSASLDRNCAEVRIRDTGIGIPPDLLDHVFGVFAQIEGSLSRSKGGLGIGLALVRALVELHNGTVEARSDGAGCGSEFVVRIPLATVRLSSSSQVPLDNTNCAPHQLKILIADDNRAAAEMLALLLRLENNEVALASDGAEAEAVAEEFMPDAIIMDLGMPTIDGVEAAKRIRMHTWGNSMTLIALTGWGQAEMRERTSGAGFNYHLVKPVSREDIFRILSQVQKQRLKES